MKIMIVDDDQKFTARLKNDLLIYFSEWDESIDFSIFNNNFSKICFSHDYKIIFLDIDLIDINGIELAKKINTLSPQSLIVFVSAYNQLVYNALIVRPFFFIRKSNYDKDLAIFFDLIKELFKEKTFINTNYKFQKTSIPVNHIIYIESINHMLKITCTDNIYYDNRSLKKFLAILPQEYFCQIHKSYIINLDFLLSYTKSEIILVNDLHLNIGRVYKKKFDDIYQEYLIR